MLKLKILSRGCIKNESRKGIEGSRRLIARIGFVAQKEDTDVGSDLLYCDTRTLYFVLEALGM